ncbi:MAG TPA: AraC family ligand binding domain-containing protein, partial [Bacillota bacterium]
MADHFALEYQAAIDLSVYHCGTEKCAPGHAYGPAVRDHFLIHFVHNGYGFFQAGGRTYHLGQGQGFLICPGIITYYQADASDPWHYSWVGFQGLKAKGYLETAGLDEDHPVFRYDRDQQVDDYFRAMAAASGMQRGRELQLLGLLYQFLACLIDSREREGTAGRGPDENINRRGLYLGKAQEFISRNYSRRITIGEIARFVGL